MSSALSEHTIKHLALGFLKTYYRYRPRAEDSVGITTVDMRMEGGLIVDGFMRFIQPDNLPFTVTLEATSWQTRDEIFYRPRLAHVLWDATAFALLIIPFSLAILHLTGIYPLVNVGFWTGLSLLGAATLLWMGVYYITLRRLSRYRYIYAVEQFKQYKANDQWVAYSYDVFSTSDKKRRRELVHQCTRYGFGLLEITPKRKVKLILAPSRAEHFIPKQNAIQFFSLGEWQDRMSNIVSAPWQRFTQAIRERLRPWQSEYFRWFPRTYPNQWTLALLGSIATALLLLTEYKQRPVVHANKLVRKIELSRIPERQEGESSYFKIDAPIPGFSDSTDIALGFWDQEEQFGNIIQRTGAIAPEEELRPIRMVIVPPGEQAALYYDCSRIQSIRSNFYVLYDTVMPNLSEARQRIARWNDEGFMATAIWPKCLGGPTEGFLVYVDDILPDTTTALILRDSFQLLRDSSARPLIVREFLSGPK